MRENKRPKKDLTEIVYGGKLPPQAIDLEEAVLGAVMIEKNAISKVISLLESESFYLDSHKFIWEAIIELHHNKKAIDILTVSEKLKTNGHLEDAGGRFYINTLTERTASAGNLEYHASILIQNQIKRWCITLAGQLGKDAFDDTTDAFEIKEKLSSDVLDLHKKLTKASEKSFPQIVDNALKEVDIAMVSPDHISGITTGNRFIDAVTGGWQKTDLIIIAARPGMGKTARMLRFAEAAIASGKKAKIYSFEMSSTQLVMRLFASGSNLDLQDIRRGRLSEWSRQAIQEVAERLKRLPIKINDNGRTTIYDMSSECRALAANGDIDILLVDYVQICKVLLKFNMNRNDILGIITSELKDIAKECNIPVIALAQLSRKAESTSDGRPGLEHLREGGSIEQDADLVAFIHRPAYYTKGDQNKEKEQFLKEMDQKEYEEYSEFIIEKHRNGKLTTVREYFHGASQNFKEFFNKESEPETPKEDNNLPF